jgi:hypothetical protein
MCYYYAAVICQDFVGESNGTCLVVDGEFVLFLDLYEELGAELEAFLIDFMNYQQALDDAHPFIDKVRYVELRADSINNSEEETDGGVPTGANATLGRGVYAVVAGRSFIDFLLCILCVYRITDHPS